MNKELKLKIIESFLKRENKVNSKHKFFYNEPSETQNSKDNQLLILKIQDNIKAKQINKLFILNNRLEKENRNLKQKIGRTIGVDVTQKTQFSEIMYKLHVKKRSEKEINNLPNLKNNIKLSGNIGNINNNFNINKNSININDYYYEIEKSEILKLCNYKMLKEIEEEAFLIAQDINTIKKEKEVLEIEQNNKETLFNNLKAYYKALKSNYSELIKEEEELKDESYKIMENSQNISEQNKYLNELLNNIKNNEKRNNKIIINKKVKEFEKINNLIKDINKQSEIINKGNEEKKNLLKRIKELERNIK